VRDFSSKAEFHKKSQLVWTSHLFHRYNWYHAIDTIVELYMIVRLGIKLKSCLWSPGGGHNFACIKILILQQGCSSKGQIWALSLCMSWQMHNGSLCFPAIFSASLLLTLLHSGAILPLVVKTRGLSKDFSNVNHSVWK